MHPRDLGVEPLNLDTTILLLCPGERGPYHGWRPRFLGWTSTITRHINTKGAGLGHRNDTLLLSSIAGIGNSLSVSGTLLIRQNAFDDQDIEAPRSVTQPSRISTPGRNPFPTNRSDTPGQRRYQSLYCTWPGATEGVLELLALRASVGCDPRLGRECGACQRARRH